jgi:penicillin-binding protein 2
MKTSSLRQSLPLSPVKRIQLVKIGILLLFGGLLLRLWFLQCLYGDYYRDKSENNRIRTIRTSAPRGVIYDRDGRILVRNRPSFNVALMLEDADDIEATVKRVAEIAQLDQETVYQQFVKDRTSRRFEPKIVLRDVSREVLSHIKAQGHQLPGVIVQSVPTRSYIYGKTAAQIFGYVREISKPQLLDLADMGYRMGDVIGQIGLEKYYESVLRGYAGYVQVEVDAKGSRKKVLGSIHPVSGKDITLTLDIDLQQAGEKGLGENRGAVVALDPSSGEVLALVSSPSFDPNMFSSHISASDWEALTKDPRKPLTNRGISSAYPPGSTSKLLWALAGLQEQKIHANSVVSCPGFYRLGSRRYMCHKASGHGSLDLKTAITVSCNAYFYNLGQMLGIDAMSQYLKWFGFGQKSGIDLYAEEAGVLANEEWKLKRFNEKWYPGDTVPVSIGQGYFIATPLQMAMFTMALANDGTMYKPHLVKHRYDLDSEEEKVIAPEILWHVPVSEKHFKTVRDFGGNVVGGERGTGKRSRVPGVTVGGKTGTAQVSRRGTQHLNPDLMDHAWFVAYAPVENPEIVVSVVVENVGGGGEFAAPVAREVLHAFFSKQGRVIEEDTEKKSISGVSTPSREAITDIVGMGIPPQDSGETSETASMEDVLDYRDIVPDENE